MHPLVSLPFTFFSLVGAAHPTVTIDNGPIVGTAVSVSHGDSTCQSVPWDPFCTITAWTFQSATTTAVMAEATGNSIIRTCLYTAVQFYVSVA